MSTEDLWNTIWGKVITNIRDEILYHGGVEADTKLQRRFRNRFRVPFSMFETMVVECKDSNIFGRTQIGVEFISYWAVFGFWVEGLIFYAKKKASLGTPRKFSKKIRTHTPAKKGPRTIESFFLSF